MKSEFEKHIESQLKRLSHLAGFPTAPEGLRDYCMALQVAQTREGVQRVLDALVQELQTRDCPTAAVIRAKAWADREAQEKPASAARTWHCPECHDFGVAESRKNAMDLSSEARYCDCVAGQGLMRRGHKVGPYGCHDGGTACPECVNRARQRLRVSFKGDPLAQLRAKAKQQRNPEEVYHGIF